MSNNEFTKADKLTFMITLACFAKCVMCVTCPSLSEDSSVNADTSADLMVRHLCIKLVFRNSVAIYIPQWFSVQLRGPWFCSYIC